MKIIILIIIIIIGILAMKTYMPDIYDQTKQSLVSFVNPVINGNVVETLQTPNITQTELAKDVVSINLGKPKDQQNESFKCLTDIQCQMYFGTGTIVCEELTGNCIKKIEVLNG